MTLPRPPGIDARRTGDFERELVARARSWIPSWALDEGERDFGQALLEISARFNSEVAERLDQVGTKVARGFLDWLAIRGEAARPARMPVAFKLAETAHDPVLAVHPIKMQVDVGDATVTFETETDVRIVPGSLELIVATDPANDAVYLPPPGLTSLKPPEPAPTQWQLKDFAAPGSAILQFDPGAGLEDGMLVEIQGNQYAIRDPKGDLATIDPVVPAGEGFARQTLVKKVDVFHPFDGARNRQNHLLYLGDTDLLNVEAQATIQVIGAEALVDSAWEYWGKLARNTGADPSDEVPQWRLLTLVPRPGALVLNKPKGTIEPFKVGETESRWIRARAANLSGNAPVLTADSITLRINPPAAPAAKPQMEAIDPNTHPPAEAIVNTTPAPTSRFYLLGREPRLLDTVYIGCAEAFSKPGATAWVQFNLAASVFTSLSAINAGPLGFVLAGVDTSGALQLFRPNPDGTLARLASREPMTPADNVTLNADIAPAMWIEGLSLNVALVGMDHTVYVWQESWPFSFLSSWRNLGEPAKRSTADTPILGLALIHDSVANDRKLVALRDKRLSMRPAVVTSVAWTPVAVDTAAVTDLDIDGIVQIRHENPLLDADKLLAVSGAAAQTLYSVDVNAHLAEELLGDVASDVRPCAIQRIAGGIIEAVATKSDHITLLAVQGTNPPAQTTLGPDLTVANAVLGASVEGNQFAAYGVANSTSNTQMLISWLPFAAGIADTVFRYPVDPAVGPLRGGLTIVDPPGSSSLAILPGNNKGEIFAATLGGERVSRNASAADFLSAFAVSQPFPAIATADTVAPIVAGRPTPAVVAANPADGKNEFSNRRFFLLETWLDRNPAVDSVLLFQTSAAAPGKVKVLSNAAPFRLRFPAAVAALPAWILVDDGAGSPNILNVISYNAGTHVAVVDRLAAPLNTSVDYWLPSSTIQGSIFPALQLSAANNDWDVDLLDRGEMYFPSLSPVRQHAVAAFADALKRPQWIAFDRPWTGAPVATIFIADGRITKWAALLGDSSSNPALTWEYWNGSGWRWLHVDDQTSNFRDSGLVVFTVPADLKPVDWAGKTNHWIRARLVGGDYGKEKVVVKTKTNPDGSTEQTIDRTTEGIQPPYAIDFQVSYSIDTAVIPSFLKTEDSLTLRDQSDANRTSGAQIEVFTPLIYTLTHFQRAASQQTSGGDCIPDCDCPEGTASTSPAPKPSAQPRPPTPPSPDDCNCAPPAADSGAIADPRSGRRALYLGLNTKLQREPINVMFAALEQNYDVLAPLAVDALIANSFVPIVATDETRALGESGIISMSFNVEPVPTELFGQSLSWVRLTPSGGDVNWTPVLEGAYLNAVWVRSAETMTRELVGSSEGAPNLTLQLARPPLLHKSLELRVRESFIEERETLLKAGPDTILSNVEDLPGDWVLWTQVADPHDRDATDRVYALDEDTGTISFGDGLHGAIPPIGTDAIVAFRYERTDPATAGGVPANRVAARTTLNLVTPVESVEEVVCAGQSAGGLAPESTDRVVKFSASKLRHRGRAVTARDFEDIALEKFADVVQARCFVRTGSIRLVAVMRGSAPGPTRAQKRELRAVLLDAAAAGVAAPGVLTIDGPAVRRLRIDLTLRVPSLDIAGAVARDVQKALNTVFDTELGGKAHDGWPLGSSPNEDDVAEALRDVPNLESVANVSLFEIAANGEEQPWPATIKADELAMLADDGIHIAFKIPEAPV